MDVGRKRTVGDGLPDNLQREAARISHGGERQDAAAACA